MTRFFYARLTAALAAVLAAGCSGEPSRISSVSLPGNSIVSFPNGQDRVDTTLILSNPAGSVAGVDGRVLTVQTVIFNKPQDQFALDVDGNVGIRGSYHSLSMRSAKKDIVPLQQDPLGILDRTNVVSFRYRGEPESIPKHIGIIADDAPPQLTDARRHSIDLNNSLAVTMAATRDLQDEVVALRREVAELKRRAARRT